MSENKKQKQSGDPKEIPFEEILESFLKVKPPEKKKPVKKEAKKSKPKK